MNKYTNLFKISFIFYILVILARPYIMAQTWADIIFYLFIGSVLYQLIYIIYLRKKDNRKLLNSIGLFFLYAMNSASIVIIIKYILLFINGYTPSDVLGNPVGQTLYGFSALRSSWMNIICIPYLIVNAITMIIYYNSKSNNKEDDSYK